jgi:CRISPR-associated protein Csb1
MALDLTPLDSASRLLIEAELKVATGGGGRFQPTGFPDLGPALYRGADGANWLLVESPQSMANRLELACWDEAAECFDEVCNGIPFIRSVVTADGQTTTTSTVQESHRLASPYILTGKVMVKERNEKQENKVNKELWQVLKSNENGGLDLQDNQPFLLRNHAGKLLTLDPSSLLHGAWLSTKVDGSGRNKKAICGGKVRFPRVLSAYIEASSPQQANYGGVKRERIFDQAESGSTDAEAGFGSIPFPKSDFTSPGVRAYFSLDLQLLRTLGLGEREEKRENGVTKRPPKTQCLKNGHKQGNFTDEEAFLIVWSLYKIERFLNHGLTLRSNCQFTRDTITVTEPEVFGWPADKDVSSALTSLREQLFPCPSDHDPRLKADGLDDEARTWLRRNVLTVQWSGSAPVEETPTASPDDGDQENAGGDE